MKRTLKKALAAFMAVAMLAGTCLYRRKTAA